MNSQRRNAFIFGLMVLSGFCNLVYEVVWARMLHLLFGVTVFAVSTVLAAFMLGLALGAYQAGRYPGAMARPLPVLAGLHAALGAASLGLLGVLPVVGNLLVAFAPANGGAPPYVLTFVASVLLLAVPTLLMGACYTMALATLVPTEAHVGRDVSHLYAWNTLGSVLGCLATAFLLLGRLGMRGTVITAALMDLMIAGFALLLVWLPIQEVRS